MPSLHLWGRMSSLNVRKAVWAAQEVGVPFGRTDAGMAFGVVGTPLEELRSAANRTLAGHVHHLADYRHADRLMSESRRRGERRLEILSFDCHHGPVGVAAHHKEKHQDAFRLRRCLASPLHGNHADSTGGCL